jgi:dCMP deaminase
MEWVEGKYAEKVQSDRKWDTRFLELAKHVAQWSKDPSTKVGAVVAKGNRQLGLGFNGFPPSIHDSEDLLNDRPSKLALVIHGEINAVFDALTKGPAQGCTLYTYPLAPCAECAKFIAAAPLGIERVIALVNKEKTNTQIYLDHDTTKWIFDLAKIKFEVIYED